MSTAVARIEGLTDEQRDFQAAIADFCDRELGTSEQRERLTQGYTELHSQELYDKLAELGWLGVSIDEEYGGSGGGLVDACIFLEGTMRGLVPMAGYGVSLIVAGAYERFGTEEQKQEILGGITSGRVEAIAMSEPEAGSDVGNLSCKVERQTVTVAASSSTARRRGSRRRTSPTTSSSSAAPTTRAPSTRA